MTRWLLVAIAACSHPAAPQAVAPPPPAATGVATDFRAYVAPPPLASPGPPTAAGNQCTPPDRTLALHETARETAALDAALRANGGMLISAHMAKVRETEPPAVGTIFRGPQGERWLVVGETRTCNAFIPLVAIDRNLEVFTVQPVAQPKQTRTIALCQPFCGGCGIETPEVPVVVEVPAGAHLGARRDVTFPMDVQVIFSSQGRCEPVP